MRFLVALLVYSCAADLLDTRSLTESSTVSQGFFLASDFEGVAPPPGSLSLSEFTAWGGLGAACAYTLHCMCDTSWVISW